MVKKRKETIKIWELVDIKFEINALKNKLVCVSEQRNWIDEIGEEALKSGGKGWFFKVYQ